MLDHNEPLTAPAVRANRVMAQHVVGHERIKLADVHLLGPMLDPEIKETTQEIAILKSMGASPTLISNSFLLIGFYSGILGSIIGITTGLTIAVNINELIKGIEYVLNIFINFFKYLVSPFYELEMGGPFLIFNPEFYLEEIPVRISFFEIFIVAFITILMASLFAYLPSKEAGRIKPMEVMRKY